MSIYGCTATVDSSDSTFYYTFGGASDQSIVAPSGGAGCYCNSMKRYYEDKGSKQLLNANVFLGSNCHSNTFGNGVGNNTFGNGCYSNTFGNGVGYNTFGNGVGGNTFGNDVGYNTFGNDCYYNTFGNYFQNNTFGNYVRQLTVFDGVMYCAIVGGSDASSYVQNAQILNGTKGDDANNLLTITFVANSNSTQCAAKNSSGTLKVWYAADLVA
jgi:hypothetical protein